MVELAAGPPHLLLTDHLDGERPILVYWVDDLDASLAGGPLRDPPGAVLLVRRAGGHRIALYQEVRPGVDAHFRGRFDFS